MAQTLLTTVSLELSKTADTLTSLIRVLQNSTDTLTTLRPQEVVLDLDPPLMAGCSSVNLPPLFTALHMLYASAALCGVKGHLWSMASYPKARNIRETVLSEA